MSKKTELVWHLDKLCKAKSYSTNAKLAYAVSVSPSRISEWRAGGRWPSSDTFWKLGKLAGFPDCIWFWEQAGMEEKTMLSVAVEILKRRGAPPAEGEIIRVGCVRMTAQGIEETGDLFPIAAVSVPNPASIVCLIVDEYAANAMFPVGSRIVLDTSQNGAKDLMPFWERIVLVDVHLPQQQMGVLESVGLWGGKRWPNALSMGQLQCKRSVPGIPGFHYHCYVAVLTALGDVRTEIDAGSEELRLAAWHHPSNHTPGTPEEIAAVEAEARNKALSEMELLDIGTGRDQILGIVKGWYPAPSKGGK